MIFHRSNKTTMIVWLKTVMIINSRIIANNCLSGVLLNRMTGKLRVKYRLIYLDQEVLEIHLSQSLYHFKKEVR
jgi:hypothetical protein